jgi:uncharacterized signal transduction histidine kinase-like protein DUF2222
MKRVRRHLTPLATDTVSPLDLPPLRMGLLTKLNMLTVGLIFLTAVATTGYYLWQQWRDEEVELRAQGRTVIQMLVELSEYGLYTNDRAQMDAVLDTLNTATDIAYVSAVDARRKPIAERLFARSLRNAELPALDNDTALPALGTSLSVDRMIRGRRYIELIAPVGNTKSRSATGSSEPSRAVSATASADASPPVVTAPLGYLRLGMTFETMEGQFRKTLISALTVVGLLVMLAIGATLLLTRRLVAPMRRLMRAARAVGSASWMSTSRQTRPTNSGSSPIRSTT